MWGRITHTQGSSPHKTLTRTRTRHTHHAPYAVGRSETKYGKFGWKPSADPSELFPGTYYLQEASDRPQGGGGRLTTDL